MSRARITDRLLVEVSGCELCAAHLPLGPRPVLQYSTSARILIAGQAPGKRAHRSGIPFDDPSGDRLRDWLGIDRDEFYDADSIAILPMGFCYPGSGGSGDLPPRPGSGSLSARVAAWRDTWPGMVPLPHPSPRNNRWLKQNPWFEGELLPALREQVSRILRGNRS